MKKGDLLERKDALDKKTSAWAAQPGHEDYKEAIDKLEHDPRGRVQAPRSDDFDRRIAFGGSRLLGTALSLTRWAEERGKKDRRSQAGLPGARPAACARRAEAVREAVRQALDRGYVPARALCARSSCPRPSGRGSRRCSTRGRARSSTRRSSTRRSTPGTGRRSSRTRSSGCACSRRARPAQLRASRDPFLQAAHRIWAVYKAEEKKRDERAGELMLVDADVRRGDEAGPRRRARARRQLDAARHLRHGQSHSSRTRRPSPTRRSRWPADPREGHRQGAVRRAAEAARGDQGEAVRTVRGREPRRRPADRLPVRPRHHRRQLRARRRSTTRASWSGWRSTATRRASPPTSCSTAATTRTIHVDVRYMLWTMDALDGADRLEDMG